MPWVLACALLVAVAPSAHVPPSRQADATALFERAVALQDAGQLDAAAETYRAFLEQHPRNVEAWSNLGVVYSRLGRFNEAIAAYQQALSFSHLNTPVRMNLALAYYKSGRHRQAIGEFDVVIAANPWVPDPVLLKADSLMQLGAFADAAALLKPLAPKLQDQQVFSYLLGMALLQSGETEAGLEQLDRILKDGDSAEARLMMGVAKRAGLDYAGARDEFAAAVQKNPDLPLAHSLYGQALLATGDREAARRAFERELAGNPADFESNLYLGVIHKEDRDFDTARRYFDRALDLRPVDPGTRYQMASLHLAAGENDRALALLEPLVREAPQFIEARVSLATVYYRLKRKEDGDRERDAADRLRLEAQAKQQGSAQP
jgi:tetratricopeptide (TPR) repeat protein